MDLGLAVVHDGVRVSDGASGPTTTWLLWIRALVRSPASGGSYLA